MSSNNKSESSDVAMAIGLVAASLMILAVVVLAVAAFVALALTIWCIAAWNRPVAFAGNTLEPAEARAYVARGLLGAALVPAFVGFCQLVFGVKVEWAYLPLFMLTGYTLGSLGIAYFQSQVTKMQAPELTPPAPRQIDRKSPQPAQRSEDAEPFRFATWDDEEDRR